MEIARKGHNQRSNKPAHEIMVLSVLRKYILQTRMHSHPVGLNVWFSVGPFVYSHTSCVRTANALARLRGCAGWLAWAFAGRLCDKYHKLMSWLIFNDTDCQWLQEENTSTLKVLVVSPPKSHISSTLCPYSQPWLLPDSDEMCFSLK